MCVVVMDAVVWLLLQIVSPVVNVRSYPPGPRPPHPPTFFACPCPSVLPDFGAQQAPPLVLLVPVIRPVLVPVLAEVGRERLGREEELDLVPARREVFLHDAPVLVLDEMPLRAAFVSQTPVREEEGEMAEPLAPPDPSHHHDSQVELAEPAVRGPDPAAGPPDPTAPLARAPDQDAGHDAAHQRDLLGRLDDPVDGAAEAAAIFARVEEEKVDEG